MLFTARAYNGMVVSPHRLATEAGLAILRRGGNAAQAAVATAATLCVVYPHMTGLGGDAVWMILPAGETRQEPFVIDALGAAARLASQEWYAHKGHTAPPGRGALAAMTMAGAVSGWQSVLEASSTWRSAPGQAPEPGPQLALEDIFADAVALAEEGYPVSASQSRLAPAALKDLAPVPGFGQSFLPGGLCPAVGRRLRLPRLARTLRLLAREGLDSFYRGSLAENMARDLEAAGSPLRLADFASHRALVREALSSRCFGATLYNSPPPTQGAASLMILALVQRLAEREALNLDDEACLVHAVVEATKTAFDLRDRFLTDPKAMKDSAESLLEPAFLDALAREIPADRARPWPFKATPGGDTVWIGAMDRMGNSASCLQSIYHEFGSGLTLPGSGVLWHNRGLGFVFDKKHVNRLEPGKRPLHTLNPALARFDDGRDMLYGTMGGDGQPQTQAALFLRYARLGRSLQEAVTQARWLLGRAWGDKSLSLKLEGRFAPKTFARLRDLGHDVEVLDDFSYLMGHAGALARHPDGLLEAAFDPRGDGAAGCW